MVKKNDNYITDCIFLNRYNLKKQLSNHFINPLSEILAINNAVKKLILECIDPEGEVSETRYQSIDFALTLISEYGCSLEEDDFNTLLVRQNLAATNGFHFTGDFDHPTWFHCLHEALNTEYEDEQQFDNIVRLTNRLVAHANLTLEWNIDKFQCSYERDRKGQPALHIPVDSHNIQILEILTNLINRHIYVNWNNSFQENAIGYYLMEGGKNLDVIKLLVMFGSNVFKPGGIRSLVYEDPLANIAVEIMGILPPQYEYRQAAMINIMTMEPNAREAVIITLEARASWNKSYHPGSYDPNHYGIQHMGFFDPIVIAIKFGYHDILTICLEQGGQAQQYIIPTEQNTSTKLMDYSSQPISLLDYCMMKDDGSSKEYNECVQLLVRYGALIPIKYAKRYEYFIQTGYEEFLSLAINKIDAMPITPLQKSGMIAALKGINRHSFLTYTSKQTLALLHCLVFNGMLYNTNSAFTHEVLMSENDNYREMVTRFDKATSLENIILLKKELVSDSISRLADYYNATSKYFTVLIEAIRLILSANDMSLQEQKSIQQELLTPSYEMKKLSSADTDDIIRRPLRMMKTRSLQKL